jgi:hypothetical protein
MGERVTDSPVVKFTMTSQRHTSINFPLPTAGSARRAGFSSGPSRFFFVLAMFAFLAAAEYLFMSWATLPRGSGSLGENTSKKNFIFSIKGLETTKITGDEKIRLKIGSVMVAPRKFLVFSIQPLNEALFDDFSVDYFRLPHNQAMFPLSVIQETLLPADGMGVLFSGLFNLKTGVITRGLIRRFTLTVYEGDEIKTVVKSAKAELDFKNNKIRLEDASIEQHDFKRIIKSSEAVLKNSDGTVNIPGKYLILHPEGVLNGSGVKIRL